MNGAEMLLGELKQAVKGLTDAVSGLREEIHSMRKKNDEANNKLENRIRRLEFWQYKMIGISVVVFAICTWLIPAFIKNILN